MGKIHHKEKEQSIVIALLKYYCWDPQNIPQKIHYLTSPTRLRYNKQNVNRGPS